jgi:hypothetical protein
MPIYDHTNVDPTGESEGRHPRGNDERVDQSWQFCKGVGDAFRSSRFWKKKGVVMEQILKLLGYREKTKNAHVVIERACLINLDAEQRLSKVRATLNGEDTWFKGESADGQDAE